jgi:hypothetical protein
LKPSSEVTTDAAVHAAVVDAGEHDEGAGGINVVGDRQQQRDRQRRADPGQHPDRGSEQHTDGAVQEVTRFQRRGETVEQVGDAADQRTTR